MALHTHYDNLKVARNAPPEIIRAAYKVLAQKYHPDRHPNPAEATRVMNCINTAYTTLIDPAARAEHDQWIKQKETVRSATRVMPNRAPGAGEAASSTARARRANAGFAPSSGAAGFQTRSSSASANRNSSANGGFNAGRSSTASSDSTGSTHSTGSAKSTGPFKSTGSPKSTAYSESTAYRSSTEDADHNFTAQHSANFERSDPERSSLVRRLIGLNALVLGILVVVVLYGAFGTSEKPGDGTTSVSKLRTAENAARIDVH